MGHLPTSMLMPEFSSILRVLLQLFFGGLFLASGISKHLRPRSILHMVESYRLLSPSAVPLVAGLLAPAEVAAGALMLSVPWLPTLWPAWLLTASLLSLFTLAIATALWRGLRVPCGCGLLLNGHVITVATLVRNLALLATLGLLLPLESI